MRIVCISDTHEQQYTVPDGDILIHAGDLTFNGREDKTKEALDLLNSFPHKNKLLVAGNHDWLFDRHKSLAKSYLGNVIYLENQGVTINNTTFWGSPWQPYFNDWAFNLARGEPMRKIWAQIPNKLDVLITHSPPFGILDIVPGHFEKPNVGCLDMLDRVIKVKPKLHIFGHIHHSYGECKLDGIHFINAALCNENYQLYNPPIIVDL